MAWIATKEIKTAKFVLSPGMTLPPVYNGPGIVRQLKRLFGNESIVYHDYRRGGSEFGMDAKKLLVDVADLKDQLSKSTKTVAELSAANATLSNDVEDAQTEIQRLMERVTFLESDQKTRGKK